ncbi:hypothetical protein ACFY3N_20250 [Streptomyces sp. NPDC000348]|uniref:hypothetical protein n=1 Tax=Streptomyces sp. NPDC000348 TaxID=3364538 RepID=UPI0036D15B7F
MPPVLLVLLDEQRRFRDLLDRGRRVVSRPRFQGSLNEGDFAYLLDTHGPPRNLVAGQSSRKGS